jgi:hypothetical protein
MGLRRRATSTTSIDASPDKSFRIIGRAHGFAHDYSHADLLLGLHAPDDVYPVIFDWLEQHRMRKTKTRKPRTRSRRNRLQLVP